MFFLQHNAPFGQKGHHLALWIKISDECWLGEEGG